MSFSLEFYSLSWDALRKALSEREPVLIQKIKTQQWPKLQTDDDLGQPTHHTLLHQLRKAILDERDQDAGAWQDVDDVFAAGLDEIGQVMKRPAVLDRDPSDISDKAALVFAAFVRQLGNPVGTLTHDGAHAHAPSLQVNFREMFLDGVVGSCFSDHSLGDKLAARPMFGLFHLDFVAWGGLTQQEIAALLPKYQLAARDKQNEEWLAVGKDADAWLSTLVASLRGAENAKSDLVTLYLTVQHQFKSFWEGTRDEVAEDFLGEKK